MSNQTLTESYRKFKGEEEIFRTLMQYRVREILLVSPLYDAFIFEQDGGISDQVFGAIPDLSISVPRIMSVPTGEDALRILDQTRVDLVITMMRIGSMTPFELSQRIKHRHPELPVLLLLNVQSDLALMNKQRQNMGQIDNVFLWSGDSQIFLAMIKYIEDRANVEYDTAHGLVRVILLVEDSIYFYSRFLPILYREMMSQTQRLIDQELTAIQKKYRRRTRPKVLAAHTYEEALSICDTYREYLLCVISDVRFPRQGCLDDEAGCKLIRQLQGRNTKIPMLLQSSDRHMAEKAQELGVGFVYKHSNTLLTDLREFIHTNLGFGDFIFRNDGGQEIARARTIPEFEQQLTTIPAASILYHARRNQFSAWLLARGEIQVARFIRPLQVEDFGNDVENERKHLLEVFRNVRSQKNKGNVIEFDAQSLTEANEIVRLADGSLGGKGRGIAFLNTLIVMMKLRDHFQGITIQIPKTAVIGTDEFDRFLDANDLRDTIRNLDDSQMKQRFLDASLSEDIRARLSVYLDQVTRPIAVRSSGLLEDSQSQPFAGIYQTYLIPNSHADKGARLQHLEQAIKLVYASTFLKDARKYIEHIHFRMEEEKMAIILQEVVGEARDDHYYPTLSGVAQSYNYYPTSYMRHEDGTALLALGLGQWIVDGESTYRFCPNYPKIQAFSPEGLLDHGQTAFYALKLTSSSPDLTQGETAALRQLELQIAEDDGVLAPLASVWDPNDRRLRDGLAAYGPRVLTFAHMLKYNKVPLADILRSLLLLGERAFGVPVEIEFALNMSHAVQEKRTPAFYLLQIRPLSVHAEEVVLQHHDELDPEALVLYTGQAMGNGIVSHLSDIVYVDLEKFDKTRTLEMKQEIEALNDRMAAENREYILIGPGRWGSRDRFLGIPVHCAGISQARVIVETGTRDFVIDASQGTHFLHNLAAMNTGYFTVPYRSKTDFIAWEWLTAQQPYARSNYFVHLRRETPFLVKMFGRQGIAVIYK